MAGHPAHRVGTTCTLRASEWDGPPPVDGDLLRTPAGSWYLVDRVSAGAGVGHYRLDVTRIPNQDDQPDDGLAGRVFTWRWARRVRA